MSGQVVMVTDKPHKCRPAHGSSAYWPAEGGGPYHSAHEGSVYRCSCGQYFRVIDSWWKYHYPGPFKRRRYRRALQENQ